MGRCQDCHAESCAYRLVDDKGAVLKCGIGHCLSDDVSVELAEAVAGDVSDFVAAYYGAFDGIPETASHIDSALLNFLDDLQQAHDLAQYLAQKNSANELSEFFMKNFEANMKDLAEEHHLNY